MENEVIKFLNTKLINFYFNRKLNNFHCNQKLNNLNFDRKSIKFCFWFENRLLSNFYKLPESTYCDPRRDDDPRHTLVRLGLIKMRTDLFEANLT